jgi:hypothetical protein
MGEGMALAHQCKEADNAEQGRRVQSSVDLVQHKDAALADQHLSCRQPEAGDSGNDNVEIIPFGGVCPNYVDNQDFSTPQQFCQRSLCPAELMRSSQ